MNTEGQSARPGIDHFSFADLVRAEFEVRRPPAGGPSADLAAIYRAFTKRFGPIVCSRFGGNTPCGVALTDLKAAPRDDATSPPQLAGKPEQGWWRRWLGTLAGSGEDCTMKGDGGFPSSESPCVFTCSSRRSH